MTVTLSSAGGSSVPNWILLQNSAPSGVSAVTFSGLSGYSKYRVEALGLVATTSNNPNITINGDTASKYSYWSKNLYGAAWSDSSANLTAKVVLPAGSGNTNCNFVLEIDKALVLSPKNFVFSGATISNGTFDGGALYQTTSAMTSVTVTNAGGTNYTAGNIYLYGAN